METCTGRLAATATRRAAHAVLLGAGLLAAGAGNGGGSAATPAASGPDGAPPDSAAYGDPKIAPIAGGSGQGAFCRSTERVPSPNGPQTPRTACGTRRELESVVHDLRKRNEARFLERMRACGNLTPIELSPVRTLQYRGDASWDGAFAPEWGTVLNEGGQALVAGELRGCAGPDDRDPDRWAVGTDGVVHPVQLREQGYRLNTGMYSACPPEANQDWGFLGLVVPARVDRPVRNNCGPAPATHTAERTFYALPARARVGTRVQIELTVIDVQVLGTRTGPLPPPTP